MVNVAVVFGLVLDLSGALLMAVPSTWSNKILQKRALDRRDVTKAGMILISAGFTFQLIGQFI